MTVCKYFNSYNNIGSIIDHTFVSQRIINQVQSFMVLDNAVNLSDHRPLSILKTILY